jgi:hypothetical protein
MFLLSLGTQLLCCAGICLRTEDLWQAYVSLPFLAQVCTDAILSSHETTVTARFDADNPSVLSLG